MVLIDARLALVSAEFSAPNTETAITHQQNQYHFGLVPSDLWTRHLDTGGNNRLGSSAKLGSPLHQASDLLQEFSISLPKIKL